MISRYYFLLLFWVILCISWYFRINLCKFIFSIENIAFVWFYKPRLIVCKEAWGPVKGTFPGRVLCCIWKNPSSEWNSCQICHKLLDFSWILCCLISQSSFITLFSIVLKYLKVYLKDELNKYFVNLAKHFLL